jgi:SAM-dependent methyltransferase
LSAETWLRSGETDARLIRELVERNDGSLAEMEAILDFGCGCGRIARWWADLRRPQLFGCDYNGALIDWCQANLPFMTVQTNAAQPPLSFGSEAFDLIYAISVFSHLDKEPQRLWMRELRRLLKPDGLLLFTVHGNRFATGLPDKQRAMFRRGELVIRSPYVSGTNTCSAFHPEAYVRQLLRTVGLELVEAVDEDRSGTPNSLSPLPLQDNYLARKPRSDPGTPNAVPNAV